PVEEILSFQEKVRTRLRELYRSGSIEQNRKVGRAVWMSFEHEAMHLETLLYILLQSEKTLPPPGTAQPDFKAIAEQARAAAVPNKWVFIPETTITIGLDDPETELKPDRYFG